MRRSRSECTRMVSLFKVGSIAIALTQIAYAQPKTVTPHIVIDQFGYLPNAKKIAVIVDPIDGFNSAQSFSPGTGKNQYEVRHFSDDKVMLTGSLSVWNSGKTDPQSGDKGWYFDFSTLKTEGTYYIFDTVKQVGSNPFRIAKNVYNNPLKQATRALFYQRLGIDKKTLYTDTKWTDVAAYKQDQFARLYSPTTKEKGGGSTEKDLRGGWMDAGDPNKYVTFAQKPVIQLLEAYRLNPGIFGDANNIPESNNGVPDLLDEVKWELDFIKRMQDATGTGGLLLKVGADAYGTTSPMSLDNRVRYYLPECTSSTLAGASMFAAGAMVFQSVKTQGGYGQNLLNRAKNAWNRAEKTTVSFTHFDTDCDDGVIKAGDADQDKQTQIESAFVAAVYLFEATQEKEFQEFIDNNYTRVRPFNNSWWGPYRLPVQWALLRYAVHKNATQKVSDAIKKQKASMYDVMSITQANAQTDLYRAFMPDAQFHWSHLEVRADVGNINLDFVSYGINTINNTNTTQYISLGHAHAHYIHGVNPLGLVYLSNMSAYGASKSINELYHAWFDDGTNWDNAATSKYGPAPGYLVGGPNKSYKGTVANITNQPPQKAFLNFNDKGNNAEKKPWELSEPAIYHQAAYIMLLSRIMTTP